jgi:acyl-CoA hydrolase
MSNSKTPSQSYTIMNELVLPNDTNTLNNLMGGRLLHWMDIVAAISGQKHTGKIVVTASVDSVSFGKSIKLGDVVTLEAKVTRAFNTSMEIHISVIAEVFQPEKSLRAMRLIIRLLHLTETARQPRCPNLYLKQRRRKSVLTEHCEEGNCALF